VGRRRLGPPKENATLGSFWTVRTTSGNSRGWIPVVAGNAEGKDDLFAVTPYVVAEVAYLVQKFAGSAAEI
jgi:hypothetical protein